MIYQFEYKEITNCAGCPCCDNIIGCQLGEVEENFEEIPTNCPLVVISKTEATSCEWCEGNVSKYFDVNWYNFIGHERLDKSNYCPACGRKLD